MSLNKKKELVVLAIAYARKLRKESTTAEKIFWELVRDRRFSDKKFLRQHPLFYDIQGRESFFIADFYCHERKLVVELDGPIHKYKLAHDKFRDEILNSLGLHILRFKNVEVENSLEIIKRKLSESINSP
ncbi:MAG: endonuclease domain-containing protein [Bacteroidetes bacterium]|nr:endonuclease domain-containing protein [Bacteroidota bacterium]MCL6098969.1 endonuclease domain-containing protein [Bacteroidota bacterium]